MGGPATAGKRWPHFFQMGKLRHEEVWELAQVTHSESAFGERAAHTGKQGHTDLGHLPIGEQGQAGRAQGPGLPGGDTWPFQGGWWGGRGRSLLGTGQEAKSSEGAWDGGILVRTAFLARRASTSKSRLKRAAGLFSSQTGPPVPTILSKSPGRSLLGDTMSVTRQGQGGDVPPFSEQRGVGSERACQQGTCPRTALRTLLSPPQAPLSHLCWHYLGTAEVEKETRVNASVQHLREATEMGEREPSRERPPHHQKRGGTGGLEVERGRQEGASEPRGEEGPSASCGRPAV